MHSSTNVQYSDKYIESVINFSDIGSLSGIYKPPCSGLARPILRAAKTSGLTPRQKGIAVYISLCECNYSARFRYRITQQFNSLKEAIIKFKDKTDCTVDDYREYGMIAVINTMVASSELYKDPHFVDDIISVSRVHMFPYTEEGIVKVIDHSKYLQRNHPWLWEGLLDKYQAYFQTFIENVMVSKTGIGIVDQLLELNKSSLIPETCVKTCSDLYIYSIGPRRGGYILGLPVDKVSFTNEQVIDAYHEANKDIEGYMSKVRTTNRNRLNQLINEAKSDTKLEVYNDEDTLLEPVEDYSPADIVRYVSDNNKIYQFTRPEFKTLVDKKVNFWNRQPLPPDMILRIQRLLNNPYKVRNVSTVTDYLKRLTKAPEYTIEELIKKRIGLPIYSEELLHNHIHYMKIDLNTGDYL